MRRRTILMLMAMAAMVVLVSGGALAETTSFSNLSSIVIGVSDSTKADPYPSPIEVQNLTGHVSDVNLKLNGLIHSFPDDVAVLLVGPQGQKALLMSDTGGDVYTGLVDPPSLTLDDEATNSLPDNTKITAGTYKPTQGTITATVSDTKVPANFPTPAPSGPYAEDLSVFDGTNPNGSWDLYVLDDTAGDNGQFKGGWSLEITTESPTPQPDTTAPKVTSTTPAAGTTSVAPSANVKATFSEHMSASTISGTTFKLLRKGTTTRVGASVSYDATADRATLDPTNALKRGVSYKAVLTTDAKDLAGNRLDQNSSLSGLQQKVWYFKVRN